MRFAGKIHSFFSHPLVGILGSIASIISVALAVYFSGVSIREPLLTYLLCPSGNSVPILEVSLVKVSRPLTEISLDQSRLSSGILGVRWRILEQNDACVSQILYSGPTSVRIILTGNIEGQKQIQELTYSGTIVPPEEQYSPPHPWLKLLTNFGLWLLVIIGAAALIVNIWMAFFPGKRPTLLLVIPFIILLCLLAISTWNRFFFLRPEPPYGF
jgi:hypothetical protein